MLAGEIDVVGNPWDGRTWTAEAWSGRTWSGLSWSGRTWTGIEGAPAAGA